MQQRLFIALELPEQIKQRIAAIQSQLQLRDVDSFVRWVAPAGSHVTLKYLGTTAKLDSIVSLLRSIGPRTQPFRIKSASIGAFPSDDAPRIIWLGVSGDVASLGQLQLRVEQAMVTIGFSPEARPFYPHITLGRMRESGWRARPVNFNNPIPVSPYAWIVDALTIMESRSTSHGVKYCPLKTIPFDVPPPTDIIKAHD
ncbi:MAG: RNA 2',3'-cyclic phosphodiesterase [Herpetosiphon sp.]